MWDAAEAWLEDKVDVLMNNAGVFSRADWRPMADINMTGLLAGTMLAMQAADIEEVLLWCTKECRKVFLAADSSSSSPNVVVCSCLSSS